MTAITGIEDLRLLAQKRVPRMFYDDADSGSYTQGTCRANESDFQAIKLHQRVDDMSTTAAFAPLWLATTRHHGFSNLMGHTKGV
jgi:hypothetical protein